MGIQRTLSEHLLNLTILTKLTQLEGRVPGLISQQLGSAESRWDTQIGRLTDLLTTGNYKECGEIMHSMRGHLGMLGLSALSGRLEALESAMTVATAQSVPPIHWEKERAALNELKTRSLAAAREYLKN
jgi:HPt (histidine-containing phosphotransfer) domain-containing protein